MAPRPASPLLLPEFRPPGLEPALFHEPPDQPGGLCLSSLSEMRLLLLGEARGSRNAGDEQVSTRPENALISAFHATLSSPAASSLLPLTMSWQERDFPLRLFSSLSRDLVCSGACSYVFCRAVLDSVFT
ncbi:uncharacterized protein [Symphalangus syndactylus]|uniref:uncharacterized protein isoform X2 n=1 Tax=Symphalangus syndactylus TaxID=9590 RepID=UPI0030043E18